MTLHVISEEFSVCKLKDYSQIDPSHPLLSAEGYTIEH